MDNVKSLHAFGAGTAWFQNQPQNRSPKLPKCVSCEAVRVDSDSHDGKGCSGGVEWVARVFQGVSEAVPRRFPGDAEGVLRVSRGGSNRSTHEQLLCAPAPRCP
eukprot:10325187-Alexandrium_andersonii.AAC.1